MGLVKNSFCVNFFSFFSSHNTSTFQLLDNSRGHRCRPFFPPGSCLQFLSRIGFSNPPARRISSNVANSRSRAFPQINFVHKKKPLRIYASMHSGGLELTRLTYTRLEDNLTRYIPVHRWGFMYLFFCPPSRHCGNAEGLWS